MAAGFVAILLFGFFGLLALGLPVAIALAGASIIFALVDGTIPLLASVHRMVGGVESFPLLCVPFFIFAGMLKNSSGITERIYAFAVASVGWMRGGLGQVNVVGSVVFAGMSGTAVGDAAGLGTIEVRAMRAHGYDPKFAVGITAASYMLGPLLPSSVPLVIYGVSANASIGQLFEAGIVPGLLVAACLMIMVYRYAWRYGYGADAKFRIYELGRTLMRGILPLLTPVLFILARVGGISFEDAARGVLPFMVPLLGVLMLCTYVPEVMMYLPNRWYR